MKRARGFSTQRMQGKKPVPPLSLSCSHAPFHCHYEAGACKQHSAGKHNTYFYWMTSSISFVFFYLHADMKYFSSFRSAYYKLQIFDPKPPQAKVFSPVTSTGKAIQTPLETPVRLVCTKQLQSWSTPDGDLPLPTN